MLQLIVPGLYGYIGSIGKNKGIAAFDLGGTIISKHEEHVNDKLCPKQWYFLPNRISVLQHYYNTGYTIVIFSNSRDEIISVRCIDDILSCLLQYNIHPWIFVSAETNTYRKPHTGMWQTFLEYMKYFKLYHIDYNTSFYTGDKQTDIQFAQNIGLRFYSPEDVFKIN